MKLSQTQIRTYSWMVLGGLFVVLGMAFLVYDRVGWPQTELLAGESTYLMQAESLARDFDLAYTSQDFRRFLLAHHGEAPDLELASGSAGRTITYDRPFPYALWLAPFVRLAPEKGFVFANLLLLALASLLAAKTLEKPLGPAAPFWVAIFLFASVAWSYIWLATGDLFLLAVVVIAFSLLTRLQEQEGRLSAPKGQLLTAPRLCLAAGALLSIPLATEPLYGLLLLAGFLAVPKTLSVSNNKSAPPRATFSLGFILALLIQVIPQWWWSGGLHFFGSHRFRFTPNTGFPLVDFTAADWKSSVTRLEALHWDGAPRFSWGADPLLWLWDLLYVAAGRHIGILPYFVPVVLLLVHGSFRGYRRGITLAAGLWILALIMFHPFNLYGGEGAIANRLFLPVYGALWFIVSRPPKWPAAVAIAALASLFQWSLWTSPWRYPISRDGGYTYVTQVAEATLPFETSQKPIPAADLTHHMGLRINLLNEGVWSETRRDLLKLDADRRASMVIASPVKLPSLVLEFGADAPAEIHIGGATVEKKVLLADGGISFRLKPGRLSARHHAMWWSPERQWLYVLDLDLPKAADGDTSSLSFQLFSEVLFEEP